ncbi:hypothetical protein ARMGADRAFT_1031470 [Armillaria gallica]|uniref:Uncharacterized protein n=1 Tax=Armillaria gallica TaxID=47427 RepID=A0A2H3DD12_ARMGA|nr:hypothetical protein ARMGADRAFT_1031470 [Armillaria gallica]
MPEVWKLFFFYWVIKDFIQYSNRKSLPLNVLQLRIDAKEDEDDSTIALPKHAAKMTKQEMVFPLTKSIAHLTCGDKSVTTIYPSSHAVPLLHHPLEDNETKNDICQTAGLILKNVIKHARLIQVLAHCSPNIYTINDWFNTTCKVDRKTHKFKGVLAFQLENHVLAFCSYDNNVRSTEDKIHDCGEDYTDNLLFDGDFFEFMDPLVNFHGWLEMLVAGLETRRLRRLAESKCCQQEKLNQKLHGSGSKPKAGAKSEEDLEIEEMQEKQKKVTEDKADKAAEKSKSMLTPKKAKKKTKQTEQKASTKAVNTKKKKKTASDQGNKVDKYFLHMFIFCCYFHVSSWEEKDPIRARSHHSKVYTNKSIRQNSYSSGIILHNSGVLPLTKAEGMLNSPGRLARLIKVYVYFLSYMETAEDTKYYESLSIHERSKCYVSDQHASLIKAYNSANGPLVTPFSGPKYYNPFEPAYIADTLSKQGHLGHLIFDKDVWKALHPAALVGEKCGLDPLSQYSNFLQQKKVNLCKSSFSVESKYLDLICYNNTLEVPLKERHFTPHVYWYNSIYKQIWSVLDIPSSLLYAEVALKGRLLATSKSEHCGHNSKTLTKVQSKWKGAEDATEQIEEAWYGRCQSLWEAELADVAEERAWQFAGGERQKALVEGSSNRCFTKETKNLCKCFNQSSDKYYHSEGRKTKAHPTEHAARSDHDDTRPENGEQAGAGDDEVDGDEETVNGLEKRISALYPIFDEGPLKAQHF